MPSPTEIAARTYVAAWQEPDPAARARMVEACFAAEGRLVSRGQVMNGPAALVASMDSFFADPRGLSARLVSAIDVQGPLFRFHAAVADREGRVLLEGFDAAEVDADGRITVLLTFGGTAPSPAAK
jgi:hypothetical protein